MNNTRNLSRLMKMSWDIQRSKSRTRAQALRAAWAIFSNEDVSVFYLVKKLNHHKEVSRKALHQISLFPTVNR